MSSAVPVPIGENLDVRPTEPIALSDPGLVWVVESGALDVFFVASIDGQPTGVRHHVAHVEPGQAAFGMANGDNPAAILLAVAAPETRVRRIGRELLAQMGSQAAQPLGEWLAGWIQQLSESVVSGAPPKLIEPLIPGDLVWVKPGRVAVAREGVIWAKHLEGQSTFLGIAAPPAVNGDLWFPITRKTWLAPTVKSRFAPASTEEAIGNGVHWDGLESFHAVALQAIGQKAADLEAKEAQRLLSKAAGERRMVTGSVTGLASILRRGLEAPAEHQGDPTLTAIRRIGKHLGIAIREHPGARRGIPSRDPVREISRASGIRFRKVVLRDKWWTADHGPLLAFRQETKAPVALIPQSAQSYELFDPETSSTTRVTRSVATALEPFAYTFYRPFPIRPLKGKDLIQMALRWGTKDLILLVLMGLAAGLLSLATPIFTGILFDDVIPAANRGQLMQLGIVLMVGAVSNVAFQVVRGVAALRVEGKIGSSLQAAVWDRVLSLPASFFHDYAAGDLAMRAMSIDSMRRMLTGTAVNAVLNGVFSIFNLALLFYYSWKLGLVAMGLIVISVAATMLAGWVQVRQQRTIVEVSGKLSAMVYGFISGIAKFRVSGTEPRAFAQWARMFARERGTSLKARRSGDALEVFNSVFPIVSLLTLFYAFTYFGETLKVTTGDFLAFNSAYTQFETAVLALSLSCIQVLAVVPMFERAKPILEALPEATEDRGDPGELLGRVEVTNVSFRYKADQPLTLDQVSFRADPGEFVAIVGPSGSGKSTMFRILMGFEQPESGSVFYDGLDINGLDLQALRRQMGVVLQNGTLLSGDIFMNIVGSKQLTMEDAQEAAKMAGLDDDIKRMPMGMHTMISEGGGGLSGGQRQRLMIARAIVSRPRILLFDEATSALDNRTQAIVTESLARLQATRIVIAHRLSTIIHADRIVVLQNGVVVQTGKYSELMEQEGVFRDLAKRQLV